MHIPAIFRVWWLLTLIFSSLRTSLGGLSINSNEKIQKLGVGLVGSEMILRKFLRPTPDS
jgi:hypothetical protein